MLFGFQREKNQNVTNIKAALLDVGHVRVPKKRFLPSRQGGVDRGEALGLPAFEERLASSSSAPSTRHTWQGLNFLPQQHRRHRKSTSEPQR